MSLLIWNLWYIK